MLSIATEKLSLMFMVGMIVFGTFANVALAAYGLAEFAPKATFFAIMSLAVAYLNYMACFAVANGFPIPLVKQSHGPAFMTWSAIVSWVFFMFGLWHAFVDAWGLDPNHVFHVHYWF